jgi:hypothetical protein
MKDKATKRPALSSAGHRGASGFALLAKNAWLDVGAGHGARVGIARLVVRVDIGRELRSTGFRHAGTTVADAFRFAGHVDVQAGSAVQAPLFVGEGLGCNRSERGTGADQQGHRGHFNF